MCYTWDKLIASDRVGKYSDPVGGIIRDASGISFELSAEGDLGLGSPSFAGRDLRKIKGQDAGSAKVTFY